MNELNKARTPPGIGTADIAKKTKLDKKKIMQQIKALENKREQYQTRWKQIRDFQLPHIGHFDGEDDESNQARRKDLNIYHACTWEANQVFAAGVMSGLTPPSRKWFRLNFSNENLTNNSDIGKLLDQRMDIVNDVLEKSNFYTAVHSCYLELAFGQAPLGIFPDEKYGVHFTPYTIGTYYMEAGPDGNITTFVRKFRMTALQLAEKYGEENLTESIRNALHNGNRMNQYYTVYWYVAPNPMKDKEGLARWQMEYSSIYFLENSSDDEFLYIGGFHEWPVPVARYLITGEESYAKGPGWFAEGDSKALQILEKDYLTAVELSVKPPMLTTADNVTKGINLVPGGKTYTSQPNGVQPLFQVKLDLEHLAGKIEDLKDRIKRSYSADLFLMLDQLKDKNMTAREVLERTQEKMQQLGPVVQRMQFEFLSPIIERVYNILDREHRFPEPEDDQLKAILASEEIKIEYISPLAQAQKISGLVNIEQAIAFAGQLAQFDSSVLDKIDFVQTLNKYCEMVGAPATITRSDEEYQQIQQQKAEKQMQMEQQAQMLQAAQVAPGLSQAAKNATEAANDGNPALQQMMGMNDIGAGQNVS